MAQEKKPRKDRRAYLNDFHPTARGDYVYEGKRIPWPANGESARSALTRLWVPAALGVGSLLICGCLPGTGMDGRFWVLIPYMAGLVLWAVICKTLFQLTRAERPLRAYVYEKTVEHLPGLGRAGTILAALTLLAQGANLLLEGYGGTLPMGLLFAALQALAAGCGLLLTKTVNLTAKNQQF